MATKQWTIPTVLKELRRVCMDMDGSDITNLASGSWDVKAMIDDLTKFHMDKEMGVLVEIPGQETIFTGKDDGKEK